MGENVFEDMEAEGSSLVEQEQAKKQVMKAPGEIDYDALSDIPVGDQKKYERPNLNDKVVGIKSFQVFGATDEDEEIISMANADVKYKKAKVIITYDTKNKDGMNDREYLSGAIQFVQRDESLSEPSFYYDKADNQVSNIWTIVAKHKKIDPKELSPRAFVAFLNSGVKAKLAYTEVLFKKEKFYKNLPTEIVA
jgi:hypothetical protein